MVGDLNVELVHTVLGDVSLATSVGTGSIVDANDDDLPDVIGNSIDLDANGADADIGDADGLNDLEIDSSVTFQGDVGLQAGRHIDVTEYDGTLYLVLAARRARPRPPDRAGDELTSTRISSSCRAACCSPRTLRSRIPVARIEAATFVELYVGDDLVTSHSSKILAGSYITIRLDSGRVPETEADTGHGTVSTIRGEVSADRANSGPVPLYVTRIHGNTDDDRITFDQTVLGSRTLTFGGADDTGQSGPTDGEDLLTVFLLATMNTARGHTLLLDGGARERRLRDPHARLAGRRRQLRHRHDRHRPVGGRRRLDPHLRP